MNHFFIYFSLFTCFSLASLSGKAQQSEIPSYNPIAIVVDDYGTETDTLTVSGTTLEAPLHLLLKANSINDGGWVANYEWVITRKELNGGTSEEETVLDRYMSDEETTTDFEESGEYTIYCYATFVYGSDSIKYDEEYWSEHTDEQPLKVVIATSHLEFPNAFSPNNGDDINNDYGPKIANEANKPKSIIEYHMSIYNRWGQRLFDTHDINDRWDGKYNGRDVKQGVYYVVCTAKGSDGVKYNIKKDVNLLRGIREKESSSSSDQ